VDQIPDILNHFRKAVKESRLDWLHFDYRKDSSDAEIRKDIYNWLQRYAQNKQYIEMLVETRAIGNPFAKNVIIGDICNGDLELEKYSHIIMPFAKGVSSDYLWKAIDGISKKRYLLTNARKYHKKAMLS